MTDEYELTNPVPRTVSRLSRHRQVQQNFVYSFLRIAELLEKRLAQRRARGSDPATAGFIPAKVSDSVLLIQPNYCNFELLITTNIITL